MGLDSTFKEDDNVVRERITRLAKELDELDDHIDQTSIPRRVKKGATANLEKLRAVVQKLRSLNPLDGSLFDPENPWLRETWVTDQVDQQHLQLDRWENRQTWPDVVGAVFGLVLTAAMLYVALGWPVPHVLVVAYFANAVLRSLHESNRRISRLLAYRAWKDAHELAARKNTSVWAALRVVERDVREGVKQHGQFLAEAL